MARTTTTPKDEGEANERRLRPRDLLRRDCLARFWEHVEFLDVGEATALCQAFVEAHVREDWRQKFVARLNRRPISDRQFRKPQETTLSRTLKGPVRAEVFWGEPDSSAGYRVLGQDRTLGDLFVYEGDALAFIQWEDEAIWVFLDGTGGVAFEFAGRGPA
jgi:hypothetical protein